jgi:creatinine amidohydrolase
MTLPPLPYRTWVEQAERPDRILVIPLGSFEQHGPHLPMATDTIIATTVANDAALEVECDVAPALPFGASGEHQGFDGLLSIGTSVTHDVIIELLRSARFTWKGVVLVSGHGGNVHALQDALALARFEGSTVHLWLPRDPNGDAHAGKSETSFMMTLPDNHIRPIEVPAVELESTELAQVWREGIMGVSPSGVLGTPGAATVEYGWELRRRWCSEIVELIQSIQGES